MSGPGPYGFDSKITTRGRIHTPAHTITGRYQGKGLWRCARLRRSWTQRHYLTQVKSDIC